VVQRWNTEKEELRGKGGREVEAAQEVMVEDKRQGGKKNISDVL
jgi:hypothetical protein